MNTEKIASVVKQYLIDLAVNDKLPMDLTLLNEKELASHISREMSEDEVIEKASHLLSDGELSIEEMIEAISNHENQDDYIDNVEGVVVWEKVSNAYTCYEFLDEIGR